VRQLLVGDDQVLLAGHWCLETLGNLGRDFHFDFAVAFAFHSRCHFEPFSLELEYV